VVSELSPAPSLLVCTMNTGWKRLQHEKRANVAQRMLFAEHRSQVPLELDKTSVSAHRFKPNESA